MSNLKPEVISFTDELKLLNNKVSAAVFFLN